MKHNFMDKRKKFIEKSIKKHGNRYDYSKVEYVNSTTKVCIICPEHGEFWQTPQAHVRGHNCPKCSNKKRGDTFRSNVEDFISKASIIHKNKYEYEKDKYVNSETKIPIICPKHGVFWMTPMNHLLGQGCPKCSGRGLNTEEIISKFIEKHGSKYDYSKVSYTKMHDKVCIVCPIHGEFWQTPSKHLLGQGCPKCSAEKRGKLSTMTTEDFINRGNVIHKGKYDYSKTEYTGTYNSLTITCPIHGDFIQRANDHLNGHGCPHCGNNISKVEDEICSYLDELDINYQRNNRNILKGYEIDILIPNKMIGIEYDGLKWHSEEFKPNNYHLNKTVECMKNGIRLIHIYEDEWLFKKDIIKDKLSSMLGKSKNRIYARKCKIGIPTEEEKRTFLNNTHIQGDVPSSVKLGLYYNDELVGIMTFGKLRRPLGYKTSVEGKYELLRYSTKLNTSIVGGASKLLKYFIENYNPIEIVSYCDRRFSIGNMYEKIGFTLDHISQPNYYYIVGNNRKNRFKYRKSELIKEGYDKTKSEHQIMIEKGIFRIYDCGNFVFKWKK